MQIAVTEPELEAFVSEQIAAGRFVSPEEVLASALHLLQAHERVALADLRAKIAVGIEQADRGELSPWSLDEMRREVERRYQIEQAKHPVGR